jgi:hypothetical protein
VIRFVSAIDGRGEGLAGIDIAGADRDRVRAAAARRGVTEQGDRLRIGGVDIGLI